MLSMLGSFSSDDVKRLRGDCDAARVGWVAHR